MTPAHAAALAWRARRPLAYSAVAVIAVLYVAMGLILVPLSGVAPSPGPLAPEPAPTGEIAGIPAVYLPIYRAAADRFAVSWALVAAIHRRETDFSRLRATSARGDAVSSGWNGCGAAGPTQFGIVGVAPYRATVSACPGSPSVGAGGTWARYRDASRGLARPASYPQMAATLPGCRDVAPHGCVYDDVDAIAAAAAYLHDLGAGRALDVRAWNAARAYNGAPAYADLVMEWAREYATAVGAFDGQLPVDPLGGSTETTPGVRARLAPNGLALAPNDAPEAVQRAIAAANAISDRPYLEVHYPTHIDNPTYDCSSATSHVLWGAGAFGVAPWVSSTLMRYGEPGPGRWITVYANTGHAFVIVAGLRFDTSGYDAPGAPNAGESGPRWRLGPRPTTNFVVRHPPGL
jgi:hypothetical protein